MFSNRADARRDISFGEQNQCTGKRRLTQDQTQRAIDYVERNTGYKAQAYLCPFGDHWHIGKVKRRTPGGVMVIVKVGD